MKPGVRLEGPETEVGVWRQMGAGLGDRWGSQETNWGALEIDQGSRCKMGTQKRKEAVLETDTGHWKQA